MTRLRPWLRLTDQALALHSWQYQRLCAAVTSAVRHDDQQFYAALADEQGAVAADEGLTGLWRKIKHLLPKGVARKKANIRCIGPQVDDLTAHYSQLEAGREIAYEDLLQQCARRQSDAQTDLPLQIQLSDLPTRVEVEQICKLAKKRKAPGLDGVQAEHLQALMSAHSDVFFPLLFKMWTVAAEPIQFKGGYICSIAKKTRSPYSIRHERDNAPRCALQTSPQPYAPQVASMGIAKPHGDSVRWLPRTTNRVCLVASSQLCKSDRSQEGVACHHFC